MERPNKEQSHYTQHNNSHHTQTINSTIKNPYTMIRTKHNKIRSTATTQRTQENTTTNSNNKWKQSKIHSDKEYEENLPWGDPVDIKEPGHAESTFKISMG